MNAQPTKIYEKYIYRPGILLPLISIFLFGGCMAVFIYLAEAASTQTVDFMGVYISPPWGQIPFWILAFLGFVFVAIALISLFFRFFRAPEYLEITEYSIKIPRVLFHKSREIFFADVTHIEELNVSGTRTVILKTAKGTVGVSNRLLESNHVYDTVRDSIYKQIPLEVYDSGTV